MPVYWFKWTGLPSWRTLYLATGFPPCNSWGQNDIVPRPVRSTTTTCPTMTPLHCIISHNHYDHLDHGSVKSLNSKYDDKITWFVASGTKEWMINAGCKNVVELSWWEEAELPGKPGFKFASVPCQHRCERSLWDSMKVD